MGAIESRNAFKITKTTSRLKSDILEQPSSIASMSISNDEVFIATGRHNFIDLWDARFLDFVTTLEGHQDAITCVRQTPDRRFILSCSADGSVRVWVKPSRRWACTEVISVVHGGWAWQAEWLADIGFASVGTDGHLVIWNLDSRGKLIEALMDRSVHSKSATCLTVLSEKYKVTIVTGSNDRSLAVNELTFTQRDTYEMKQIRRLAGHEAEVTCLDSFAYPRLYGSIIVSGGRDRTIRIWSMADVVDSSDQEGSAVAHVVHVLSGEVCIVKFTQEGRFFIASTEKDVAIFRSPIPGLKIESQKLACFSPGLSGSIRSLCWGGGNSVIFVGTEDGKVSQIQVPTMYHRLKRLSS